MDKEALLDQNARAHMDDDRKTSFALADSNSDHSEKQEQSQSFNAPISESSYSIGPLSYKLWGAPIDRDD